jgi:hypothetical protein
MRLALSTFVVLVVGIWTAAALADPPGLITRPDDRAGIRGANAPASTMQTPAVRPDDRAGIRGVGPDLTKSTAVRPDDRAGIRGVGPDLTQSTAVRPDDRAGIHGVGAPEIATTGLSVSGGSGFDWVDAGVGAGSTLALMFLGGGLFVASRRRGSSPTPALHG